MDVGSEAPGDGDRSGVWVSTRSLMPTRIRNPIRVLSPSPFLSPIRIPVPLLTNPSFGSANGRLLEVLSIPAQSLGVGVVAVAVSGARPPFVAGGASTDAGVRGWLARLDEGWALQDLQEIPELTNVFGFRETATSIAILGARDEKRDEKLVLVSIEE